MTVRLLERAKTSGRSDDNLETIKHRIAVFNQNTQPVLDYYGRLNKVYTVNASGSVDEVYQRVVPLIQPNLVFLMGPPMMGKQNMAKSLAEKLHYKYIHL